MENELSVRKEDEFDRRVNSLLELSESNNFGLKTLSEQMGLVVSSVKQHEIEIRDINAWKDSFVEEYKMDQKRSKNNEYIEPHQAEELDQALSARVASILNDNGIDVDLYFGRFKSKGWADAKRHSKCVGKKGIYTKKMYFVDVKEYIDSWTPYKHGVIGYKNHLDKIKGGN